MKKQQILGSGQAEVSVFWVTVKGDQNVVQQALLTAQNFAVATGARMTSGPLTPKPPPLALPPQPAAGGEASSHADGDSVEVAEETDAIPRPTPSPRKPRTFKTPDPLDELKANELPDPFKEFVGSRNVAGFLERGLLAATWLREKRSVKQFGIAHVFTCFRMVGWTLPDEPSSLLRSMKKSKYVRQVGRGLYELTTVGDNRYQELPDGSTSRTRRGHRTIRQFREC